MSPIEITLHADASWHESSRTAAYATLLDDGIDPLPRCGVAPHYIAGTTHAELFAVVAGMECAILAFPATDETGSLILRRVVVKTDSDNVVMILNGDKTRLDDIARHLLNRIRATGRDVTAEWVKAHQDPSASSDAAANNRCDGMARYHLARALTLRGAPRDMPVDVGEERMAA